MKNREDILVDVATQYYIEEKNQTAIARQYGTSRATIQRWLRDARAEGIVQIVINKPSKVHGTLAKKLQETFGLKGADIASNSHPSLSKCLGDKCAEVFKEELRPNLKIGIGWGRFCEPLINRLSSLGPYDSFGTTFIPLLGWIGDKPPSYQVSDSCRRLAEVCNGTWIPFQLPIVVEKPETKQHLMKDAYVASILEGWQSLDLAIVGIGTTHPQLSPLFASFLTDEEVGEIKGSNIVGDICGNFISIDGHFQSTSYNRRMLGVSLPELRKAKKVIAVSGGPEKIQAIYSALIGGWVDHLITDESTADALLNKHLKLRKEA